ncbi:asparaginase domain-containing protein [Thiomicrorhabdus sp. zzn3]|uniref:asparaginase domain-containing protein n=1 Tax=Thiomicrorhabdus sp. zzn3 TaxID=3039775 RepID=UPI0024367598|nr:asparaginase domain-containing protein [Thiomicrorhabdus sp. zzn3]MDG6778029.1 asparaginase domain-containing protein [Thiomicrorhabdus sp. zzn3]
MSVSIALDASSSAGLSPILLLITGGTLDKEYDPIRGELGFPSSALPDLLNEARSTLPIEHKVLMQKDSLHMTDQDRQQIEQACLKARQNHIVITHGTDTMVETAQVLQNCDGLKGKKIVLVGAMRPYRLGGSDAAFNVGAAFMAVQLAAPGVYLCMNGRLFHAGSVRKNRQLGVFEALE